MRKIQSPLKTIHCKNEQEILQAILIEATYLLLELHCQNIAGMLLSVVE